MKGVGYFIGAAALTFNYYFALGILLLLVLAAMPWAIVGLSNQLGRYQRVLSVSGRYVCALQMN
jgi:hypothetical protein